MQYRLRWFSLCQIYFLIFLKKDIWKQRSESFQNVLLPLTFLTPIEIFPFVTFNSFLQKFC